MAVVAGVDFGTLSVRVTLVDRSKGPVATATADYPLHRRREDPDFATQSHEHHMTALAAAMRAAVARGGVRPDEVEALAIDTTGSTVIPLGANMQPLDDYYVWCDHRAKAEAEEITALAHREGLEAIDWCGGVYSHEWGFAKLLHWLRHNPDKRGAFVTMLEHCDMTVATLTGVTDALAARRSACAMGHKWMWNPRWGGLPAQAFLSKVDPLFEGIREKLSQPCYPADVVAGRLTPQWAERLGLAPGIPIPTGGFDAHWDALGAGCKIGDVINVVGTSTCIIAMAEHANLIRGVCGIVPGSVDPKLIGIEAGLSATGDIFEAIARRAGRTVGDLAASLERYRPGQTGLLRMTWDNGDRTVLVKANLTGVTLGWNLLHTAEDELFAAIEGTALHTRLILDRLAEGGVPVNRVINAGGIPQHNETLNRVYANVLGKPVLVPRGTPVGLGSAIFASLAAGWYGGVAEAQEAICLPFRVVEPDPTAKPVYQRLFAVFRDLYFSFGGENRSVDLTGVLTELRSVADLSN